MSFIKTQAAEEMETHTSVEEIIRNTFAINEENDSAMKLLSVSLVFCYQNCSDLL